MVPGVLIRPRFGAADEAQFSIRGSSLRNNFHQRGINVLIDGFPYGNADGFSDFESLELQTTKYIEVFKGANALRFGGNTLGGAINLVTKTGPRRRPHREPRRGRLLRLLQGLRRDRPGIRPARPVCELQRHRAAGLPGPQPADAIPGLRHRRLPALRGRHRPLRPRLRAQQGAAPRRADPGAVPAEPPAAEPGDPVRQGGAQLRLHPGRGHLPHADRPGPGHRVGDPAQLSGPGPPALLRGHRPDDLQLQHRAALPAVGAALRPRQPLHRGLPVLRHQPDRRPVPERQRQPRLHDQEPGQLHLHLRDVRR